MTLEKFIKTKTNSDKGYICRIPNKTFNKLVNKFRYIDVNIYYYSDSDNEDWIDIEGIGYGWLWLNARNSERKMKKAVANLAKALHSGYNREVFVRQKDGIYEYIFDCSYKNHNEIAIVRLSNEDLSWFGLV